MSKNKKQTQPRIKGFAETCQRKWSYYAGGNARGRDYRPGMIALAASGVCFAGAYMCFHGGLNGAEIMLDHGAKDAGFASAIAGAGMSALLATFGTISAATGISRLVRPPEPRLGSPGFWDRVKHSGISETEYQDIFDRFSTSVTSDDMVEALCDGRKAIEAAAEREKHARRYGAPAP